MSQKTVVAVQEDGREKTVGGPYPPMKARELKQAFQQDVEDDRRNRELPEDTERVETRPTENIEKEDENVTNK